MMLTEGTDSPASPSESNDSHHAHQYVTSPEKQAMEKSSSGENSQWRSYWISFIKNSGVDKEHALHYASVFLEHELDGSMLGDFDHALLLSMGLKKAGHRIKLIRYAHVKIASKKNPSTQERLHVSTSKHDKASSRDKHMIDDKERKKRSATLSTSATSGGGSLIRRGRANSREVAKRSDLKASPGSAPMPRRDVERDPTCSTEVGQSDPALAEKSTMHTSSSSLAVTKEVNLDQRHPLQFEAEDQTDSESSPSDSSSESDTDELDLDEDEATKSIRYRVKDKEKSMGSQKKLSKDGTSPLMGRAFQARIEDELLPVDYDELENDLRQYQEIKFFFNLEPTKRYLETTRELTGRDFTEEVCKSLKCESGSLVVFTIQDNGEFVPLKGDDYINRAEIHYVIESRKVSKDIKKLKERLKKEKPVWDSDNWPLIVDFVEGKDIYMAEHGQIGLCMCPGRKKKKKRHIWARDLYKDLDRLQQVYNCDVLVTLVREQELRDLKIEDIFDEVKKRGMESLYLPIKDKWIPKSTYRLIDLVEKIIKCLRQGKTVVVHCNGGKGRSATVIVACLIALGQSISHAIKILQRVRKGTIRNPLQQAYLRKFLSEWTAAQKAKQRKKNIMTSLLEGDRDRTDDSELLEYVDGEGVKDETREENEEPSHGKPEDVVDDQHVEVGETGTAASDAIMSTTSPAAMPEDVEGTPATDLDHPPAPPSSEGEEEQRPSDKLHSEVYSDIGERPDTQLSMSDLKRLPAEEGSGAVVLIPHLTTLEKKLTKVQKLIKKTQKQIDKKESMIAKERQHLEDLKVELKRVSEELKKEISQDNRDGSKSGATDRGRRTDRLSKSSSSRSPGPMRKKGTGDELQDREQKEKDKKERKEQKEKEKEERRKEREEREREKKEKEREKREKGREEKERREKEKEERREKKKEGKMKKRDTGNLSKDGSSLDLGILPPGQDLGDELQQHLQALSSPTTKMEDKEHDDMVITPAPSSSSTVEEDS